MPLATTAGDHTLRSRQLALHQGLHLQGCDCGTPCLQILLMLTLKRGSGLPPACALAGCNCTLQDYRPCSAPPQSHLAGFRNPPLR